MTKVLITYESVEPTNIMLFDILSSAEFISGLEIKQKRCIELDSNDINWCDVIISVRSTTAYESRLAKIAKRLGKYWILLLDDDLLSLGNRYGEHKTGYFFERKIYLKRTLKNADCLLACNRLLAEKYAQIGQVNKVVMINTPIDESKLVKPEIRDGKVKIAYYVSDATTVMFDKYIKPIMPLLYQQLADKIAFYFFALHPDLGDFEDKLEIHYVPSMPFDEFKKYFADSHFDIGIAPLEVNGYSQFKYFNKYVEYTIAGMVGIYSDCQLYGQVVTNGQNGVLCDNTPQAWFEAISTTANNGEFRKEMAINAQKYAIENLTRISIINHLIQDLPELVSYSSPENKIGKFSVFLLKIHYNEFRLREYCFISWRYILTGNFKILIHKIKDKLKRSFGRK